MNGNLSCHLYKDDPVKHFVGQLHQRGLTLDDYFSPESIEDFDQMHYHGNEATNLCAQRARINKGMTVLDIGGGFGGPARFTAKKFQCQVHSIELQANLVQINQKLNVQTKLDRYIKTINGDFLTMNLHQSYDAILSFLVFLHIPDKQKLWQKVYQALKPGSFFCIEDYYAVSPHETAEMTDVVGISNLQSRSVTQQTIESTGLMIDQWQDMTNDWTKWCENRSNQYQNNIEYYIKTQGEKRANHLNYFYKTTAQLFKEKYVGGVRVSGYKEN